MSALESPGFSRGEDVNEVFTTDELDGFPAETIFFKRHVLLVRLGTQEPPDSHVDDERPVQPARPQPRSARCLMGRRTSGPFKMFASSHRQIVSHGHPDIGVFAEQANAMIDADGLDLLPVPVNETAVIRDWALVEVDSDGGIALWFNDPDNNWRRNDHNTPGAVPVTVYEG